MLLPGDDYDGCFSREGEVTIKILAEEFEFRLQDWLER